MGGTVKVNIKKFDVEMEVRNSGIELEVRSPDGLRQLGDVVITKTSIIWCKGKTSRQRGVRITWAEFIAYMES